MFLVTGGIGFLPRGAACTPYAARIARGQATVGQVVWAVWLAMLLCCFASGCLPAPPCPARGDYSWFLQASPHYVLLSDVDEREASQRLQQFEAVYESLVQQELTHSFVEHYAPNTPLWLTEGFATYYGTLRRRDGVVHIGLPNAARLRTLLAEGLVPFSDLLRAGRKEFYGDSRRYYSSVWLLLHLLHNGPRGCGPFCGGPEHDTIARFHARSGRDDAGTYFAKRAVATGPRCQACRCTLAQQRFAGGQYAPAVHESERALNLSPNGEIAGPIAARQLRHFRARAWEEFRTQVGKRVEETLASKIPSGAQSMAPASACTVCLRLDSSGHLSSSAL